MREWMRALSSTLAGSACTFPRPPPLSSISPFGQRQVWHGKKLILKASLSHLQMETVLRHG